MEAPGEYFQVQPLARTMKFFDLCDWALIQDEAENVELCSALSNTVRSYRYEVVHESGTVKVLDEGVLSFREVSPEFFSIARLAPSEGRLLLPQDAGEDVTVVGSEVQISEAGGGKLGSVHSLTVDTRFEVVGRLHPIDPTDVPSDPVEGTCNLNWVNETAMVPLGSLPTIIKLPERSVVRKLEGYVLLMLSKPGKMEGAISEVREILRPKLAELEATALVLLGPLARLVYHNVEVIARETFAAMVAVVCLVTLLGVAGMSMVRLSREQRWLGIRRALGAGKRILLLELSFRYALIGLGASLGGVGLAWAYSQFAADIVVDQHCLLLTSVLLTTGTIGAGVAPLFVAAGDDVTLTLSQRAVWRLRGWDFRRGLCYLAIGLSVGAVIVAASVGRASSTRIDAYMRAMGEGCYIVRSTSDGNRLSSDGQERVGLDALARSRGGVAGWLQPSTANVITPEGKGWTVRVLEVTPDWLVAAGWELKTGGLVSDAARPGVVIGARLAQEIFGAAAPLGETLQVGGRAVEITGLLAPRPAGVLDQYHDRESCVVVPVGSRLLLPRVEPASVWLRVDADQDSAVVAELKEYAEDTKMSVYNVVAGLDTLREDANRTYQVYRVLSLLAMVIAGQLLTHLMIVLVRERRHEFGVLRAVGATRRQVVSMAIGEALSMYARGAAPALVLSATLVIHLNRQSGLALPWDWSWCITCAAVAVLSACIGGLLASLRIGFIEPGRLLGED
jgi:putative ABC transport system permease protein